MAHDAPTTPVPRFGSVAGWGVLLAWLIAVASGLHASPGADRLRPAPADVQAEARQWIAQWQVANDAGPLVLRQAGACSCIGGTAWRTLSDRWRHAGARVLDIPASTAVPESLRRHELLAFDGDGHLLYAGPAGAESLCGGRHPLDLLLHTSAAPAVPRTALMLEPTCPCP